MYVGSSPPDDVVISGPVVIDHGQRAEDHHHRRDNGRRRSERSTGAEDRDSGAGLSTAELRIPDRGVARTIATLQRRRCRRPRGSAPATHARDDGLPRTTRVAAGTQMTASSSVSRPAFTFSSRDRPYCRPYQETSSSARRSRPSRPRWCWRRPGRRNAVSGAHQSRSRRCSRTEIDEPLDLVQRAEGPPRATRPGENGRRRSIVSVSSPSATQRRRDHVDLIGVERPWRLAETRRSTAGR